MKLITRLAAAATLAAASSAAVAAPILIVNGASGTSEPSTTSAVTNNLSLLHSLAGNTVTVVDSLPADLSGYAQVWDVRFDSHYALDGSAQSLYQGYLQAGGGLFLMGENSSFMGRNNSILALISLLGGGSIGFTGCNSTQTVMAPFNGPNPVTQVSYAAPGCMDGHGTGEWITTDGVFGSGVAFGTGDLANAMAGALTTIFDVNFMMNMFDLPNSQELTKNLIKFIQGEVEVPAPAPLALLGLGLLALRRRRA